MDYPTSTKINGKIYYDSANIKNMFCILSFFYFTGFVKVEKISLKNLYFLLISIIEFLYVNTI